MATSGTYIFDLDIVEIIEEAYEQAGLELRAPYDLTTARRSLELLLTEWANHQVNLWKVSQNSLSLTASTAEYTIADPVIDVLDGVIRDSNNIDIPLERISFEEYLNRTDKTNTGKPTQFAVKRERNQIKVNFWNTPDVSTYTFEYFALQYIQDVGSVYTNNIDIPRRFLPALVAGLASRLADKNPAKVAQDPKTGQFQQIGGVAADRRAELKNEYMRLFELARYEDRDRASFMVKPRIKYV